LGFLMDKFEENKARIQEFRPIDDVFFEVMVQSTDVCEEIVQTILKDPTVSVLKVSPQNSVRNLQGRSVRLDALCKFGDGRICNIEIQRADNDDHPRRVRYNAACITANITNPGDYFRNIPEVIIIYISQHDFLKQGKTVYHVKKTICETGKILDDGESNIYANTEVDDGSDIAALMQCFLEKDPDDPKFPKVNQRVYELKHTEGGISTMCKIMEDYTKESNIQVFIKACKLCKDTIDGVTQKIMEQFDLSHDDAAKKVSEYWGT